MPVYNVRMTDLVTALHSGKVLVMDGAMGTEIARLTRPAVFECCETYNLSSPKLIRSIHRSYLDAGADVLLTNTFQANPATLKRRGADKQFSEIWHAAISHARLDHPRPHFVLANVGPLERLTQALAAKIAAECADADGILLETWSSLDAMKRFTDHANVPLLVSFTFHRTSDSLTIQGARPEQCAQAAQRCGAVAVGANCGKEIGMDDMREIVKRYRDKCELPIFVRPNAGTPKRGWRYPRTPETMAAGLLGLLEEGIAMIGGCCGTTPAHIQRFRTVVDASRQARW